MGAGTLRITSVIAQPGDVLRGCPEQDGCTRNENVMECQRNIGFFWDFSICSTETVLLYTLQHVKIRSARNRRISWAPALKKRACVKYPKCWDLQAIFMLVGPSKLIHAGFRAVTSQPVDRWRFHQIQDARSCRNSASPSFPRRWRRGAIDGRNFVVETNDLEVPMGSPWGPTGVPYHHRIL